MTNPLDSEMVTDESLAEEPFISKLEGRSWGFAYVRSRAEKKLLEKMTSREIPCYLPVIRKMRIHHRGKVFSEIPMFPSYLFLCPEPSSLLDVRCQKEVVSLNIVEGPAENDFINELNLIRKFELFARNRKTVVNPEIQPGSTVLIITGS